MNVCAHLLPGFSRSEDADDGHVGLFGGLGEVRVPPQLGIVSGWGGLVVVDAVESDTEYVHQMPIVDGVHLVHGVPCFHLDHLIPGVYHGGLVGSPRRTTERGGK